MMERWASDYDGAGSAAAADSLKGLFDERARENSLLEERIGREWGAIFDNKSYLYNLLADKRNRSDMLTRYEEGLAGVREQRSERYAAPAAIVDYVLQKRMLTDYETSLAGELGNSAALDSLRRAAEGLTRMEELAGLGPVELKERLFLDYGDIAIGTTPYGADNPIPEVAVWPRGIIYRVQVGNFASRQSPSVFRGASPLSVEITPEGRYRYYAGGFPSDSLATAAVEQLRRAGFRSPSAVVWMDGVRIDPEAEGEEKIYRVELSGVEELPDEVRDAIAREEAGDIVRGEGSFVVTPLDAATAVRLRTDLEALGAEWPGMGAKLLKIPE
jgi:hypothetical protein